MTEATIQDCLELVQLTLDDMYSFRAFISPTGGINIYTGQTLKCNITVCEIETMINHPKAFLELIKSKLEK